MLAIGCGGAVPAPEVKPTRAVASAPASAAPVAVTGCRAEPGTVYGTEPVVFVIDAPRSSGNVDIVLLDQHQQSVSHDVTPAPGQWRPTDVPSGDFTLQVGQKLVSCHVTVNRELARDRAAEQK